jgi:hypothetical protein
VGKEQPIGQKKLSRREFGSECRGLKRKLGFAALSQVISPAAILPTS